MMGGSTVRRFDVCAFVLAMAGGSTAMADGLPEGQLRRSRPSSPLGRKRTSIRFGLLVAVGLMALVCLGIAPSAAHAQVPGWSVSSLADTTAASSGPLQYLLEIRNVGDVDSTPPVDPTCDPNGPPLDPACVTLTIQVPPGLTLTGVRTVHGGGFNNAHCSGLGAPGPALVTCSSSTVFTALVNNHPQSFRDVLLDAIVAAGATGVLTSAFGFSGGGAPSSASTVDPTRISATRPGFGIDAFDGQVTDASGGPFTQAGGHPFAASTSIDFNTIEQPFPLLFGMGWPVEPPKDILVDLPSGFIGNPTVAGRCAASDLAAPDGRPSCPASSQVGTTLVRADDGVGGHSVWGPIAVYNMSPPPGVPARFGFNILGNTVTFDAHLRSPTDYGISIDVSNVSEGLAIAGTSLTLWGVPADSAHDPERSCPGQAPVWQTGPTCPAGITPKAFLRNPTSCTAPPGSAAPDGLVTGLHIDSWTHPGPFNADGSPDLSDPRWQSATFVTHLPPAYPAAPAGWGPNQLPTGCDNVPFDPTLTLTPAASASRAGSPSGFLVDVTLPQSDDPSAIGEADLKKAVVRLPEGVRVSPSSADGLQACSPDQIGLHSTADAACPDGSKLGSLTIATPLLDQPLTGSIYLATPHANPFGSLVAIYLVAKGPGVIVKLAGKVESDPVTGQLTTTVDDIPQTPFSALHLEFDGGPRAALMTPPACGPYTTSAELTSWSGKTVETSSTFTIDQNSDGSPCTAPGFAPGFDAGTTNPVAGKDSPFQLRLTRGDRDQELRSLSVNMPTGLLGRIASTVLCSDAAASAGSCGEGSKVGSVTVGAGAGSNPFYITAGRAYITGPYKGAPFGLSIVVPAVAGPFDLGNVIVRSAIYVDRNTAALRVVSDPLPTIVQGIPLDVRDVRVLIDRPKFIVNPTSCAEKHVTGTISSILGAVAHVASRFQVGECGALPLTPKLSLSIGAKHRTGANVSTPFATTLTQTAGQTGLRSVSVALPMTLNARLGVVNQACKLAEFEAGHCTSKAKVGTAVAVTPLLRDPLKGPAYFVKNPHRALPDLMVALRGQVAFDLVGKVTIPGGTQLATRFDAIPDVPITKFTLRLVAGRNGPLGTAQNLCTAAAKAATAAVGFRGQNGKLLQVNQRLHINGCPNARKASRAKR